MNSRAMQSVVALACLVTLAAASPTALLQPQVEEESVDPRFFLFNTSMYTISLESLIGSALAGLALLFLLGALASLLPYLGGGGDSGYSGLSGGGYSGGSAHGDSYSSYARSLATGELWEVLQTVDWVALVEQLHNADDVVSRTCQQQLICELKRSGPTWGETARAASGAIDYISYVKLFRLPESVHQLLDQYDEAAETGRRSVAPCDEQYKCGVSVRNVLEQLQTPHS